MSDLLAKCDWDGDELRVELPQWPEVVTVWVNDKAMLYVPVVNDSKCDTCEAMLDCDECVRADASHKELRGLQAEIKALRELVRDLYECASHANEQDWFYFERHMLGCGMSCTVNGEGCGLSVLADRMRELGIEVG